MVTTFIHLIHPCEFYHKISLSVGISWNYFNTTCSLYAKQPYYLYNLSTKFSYKLQKLCSSESTSMHEHDLFYTQSFWRYFFRETQDLFAFPSPFLSLCQDTSLIDIFLQFEVDGSTKSMVTFLAGQYLAFICLVFLQPAMFFHPLPKIFPTHSFRAYPRPFPCYCLEWFRGMAWSIIYAMYPTTLSVAISTTEMRPWLLPGFLAPPRI